MKALLKVLFSGLFPVLSTGYVGKWKVMLSLMPWEWGSLFSPFISFVFLKYNLKLGGTQVLTARKWKKWDFKSFFNFLIHKLLLYFCSVYVYFVSVETTLGDSYSSTPNVFIKSIWDFFSSTFLLFEELSHTLP